VSAIETTPIDLVTGTTTARWTPVCALERILPDTGVTALVDGVQVAVFRLSDGSVHALDAHDPCSGANVLGRGIVGEVAGVDVVASPVHKQRFALRTGRCLDDGPDVATHPARVVDGRVEVTVGGMRPDGRGGRS
jgi:nitrite reductase (NADH) small subunit